jgi:photosystem II stability/assembly factor-like uncharacterized protein
MVDRRQYPVYNTSENLFREKFQRFSRRVASDEGENVKLTVSLLALSLLAMGGTCGMRSAAVGGAAVAGAAVPGGVEKMPLLPPAAAKAGVFPGGEGGQWPRGLVISQSDPNFLLLAIDVGGLYRTLDGGKFWQQASVGWNARGANGFAIDPKNPNHVIGLAGNSMDWNAGWGKSPMGVYLSTDKAASWKQVHPLLEKDGNAVAFDPTSYDPATKTCRVAYVSSPKAGLLRSADGGATWTKVSDQPLSMVQDEWSGPRLVVHPKTGAVYLGGKTGLFASADGGKTFSKARDGSVWGLSILPNAPFRLYVSGDDGIFASADGKTFNALPTNGIERQGKPIRLITVSPADPRRMACWVQGDNWKWARYTTRDGGANWAEIRFDNANATLPNNVRQGYFAWSPTDANVVYNIGGDWVTRSTDGGQTFHWWANGYNGIMLGGKFNFSAHDPDAVFLAFQDYNGALTTDGGKTWDYQNVSGKGWGGYCYGGFAADRRTMWYGDADGWGSPRKVRVTQDGGGTWANANDADSGKPAVFAGPDVSFGDPKDVNVGFASNWRTADKGKTWRAMAGCDGVYGAHPDGGTLYGKKGNALVESRDRGATWQTLAEVPGGFEDVSYDAERKRYYVASQDRLKHYEGGVWTTVETTPDQFGSHRVRAVAVDPQVPSVVYAGSHRDIYACNNALLRSTDAGKTWTNLTPTAPLTDGKADGPHEVAAIRVHPKTRYAWLNGQCYGMWRVAPPK